MLGLAFYALLSVIILSVEEPKRYPYPSSKLKKQRPNFSLSCEQLLNELYKIGINFFVFLVICEWASGEL